jgi:hypothetical protein
MSTTITKSDSSQVSKAAAIFTKSNPYRNLNAPSESGCVAHVSIPIIQLRPTSVITLQVK